MAFTLNVRGRNLAIWLALSSLAAPLASCSFLNTFVPSEPGESTDVIDRQQGLTSDDFRDLNHADKLTKNGKNGKNSKDDKDEVLVKPTVPMGIPPLPDRVRRKWPTPNSSLSR